MSTISPRRLLILAAVLHVALTFAIALIGKAQLMPNTFDVNGVGKSFAIDSASYRIHALRMKDLLAQGRFRDWLYYRSQLAPFHVRLYSVSYLVLGKLFGYGIVSVEPLNLTYYLAILVLTYLLGAEVFSPEVGRIAAAAVGIWPSFLLYSTQWLKDPLFIALFLLLLLCIVIFITRSLAYSQALRWVLSGVLALAVTLLTKSSTWEIVLFALLLGCVLGAVAQLRARRFELLNTIALLVLLFAAFGLQSIPNVRIYDGVYSTAAPTVQIAPHDSGRRPSGIVAQIGWLRDRFVRRYPTAGSNIDTDVQLNNTTDVIRYLPRAVEIGLLAPFPRMWFARGGQVGLAGRLLAGVEMVVMYVVLILACMTLVYERKRLSVWFVFAVAVAGSVALAYVVVNISALYRMRYPYFILIIILAAHRLNRSEATGATDGTQTSS